MNKTQHEREMDADRAAALRDAPKMAEKRIQSAHTRYHEDRQKLAAEANEYGYVGRLR
jgi:hypothetical protein